MAADRSRGGDDEARREAQALLTIDVRSELRKIARAQLQGPWQLPTELVRRACRDGASEVRISMDRGSLRIHDDGRGISEANLQRLAALLDASRSPEQRHDALGQLERDGQLALVAIAGLELKKATLTTSWEGVHYRLEMRPGTPPAVRRFAPPAPSGTQVELAVRMDRSRARQWLRGACRFAPARIFDDDRPLPRGFPGAISSRTIHAPVPGRLAVPLEGDVARVHLLQDGISSTHVTLPQAPCFEAAVELGDLARSGSPGDLREAFQPHSGALVDASIDHLIDLGRDAPALGDESRRRVTRLLLQAARSRRYAPTIAGLPLFRAVEPDGRERWHDLLTLRRAVPDDGHRSIPALFPNQDAGEFACTDRMFVLHDVERALLSELLDLRFRQPPLRADRGQRWGAVMATGVRRWAARVLDRLTPGGSTVPEEGWSPAERAFLERAAKHLPEPPILCEGRGRVTERGGRLRLPRDNPRVRDAVAAVGRDPAWIYPTLVALAREYPATARAAWSIRAWAE